MNDLLPCPFCGGDAELREADTCHDTWFVRCTICQCKTVTSYTKNEPTVTWNARAPTAPFYGAQCPTYPNCNGGCGLGCTHEIEQRRASLVSSQEQKT